MCVRITVKPGQVYPQDSIKEFIIRKMNLLVVGDFRFISVFLHVYPLSFSEFDANV